MPTKPKPRPRPAPSRWQDRASKHVRAHPMLTWSTVASIVAVAGGLWTGGAWFFGRFQIVEAAELATKLLRADVEMLEKKVERATIEQRFETQGVKSLILGNRVFACRNNARGLRPDHNRGWAPSGLGTVIAIVLLLWLLGVFR